MPELYEFEYTEETRLICVSYVDAYSAGKQSMNDLRISFEQHVFAAGSNRLASFRVGDLVIICANEKDKTRRAFVAIIMECLDQPLSNWHEQGGVLWKYNFRIQPITGITNITPHSESRQAIDLIMEQSGLSRNKLFNSRFCSNKLIDGLARLLEEGLFQPL